MLAGSRVGAYGVLERIGSGGMGDVYRARDRRLDRDVALKVSFPSSSPTTPIASRDSSVRRKSLLR